MTIEIHRATMPCSVCGAHVTELRRGRCWGCYTKWAEMRPVGRGAVCAVCAERRYEELRLVELRARSMPLCHGCASRAMKLGEIPATLQALRKTLGRERRSDERRGQGRDHRIFPRERRVGQRREGPRSRERVFPPDVDVEAAAAASPPGFNDLLDELVLEVQDADIEIIEQTRVVEPGRPRSI